MITIKNGYVLENGSLVKKDIYIKEKGNKTREEGVRKRGKERGREGGKREGMKEW